MKYQSTKLFDGYSVALRQHRAQHSHCKLLHGYSLKFKVWFESESLDDLNWVVDFGGFKHNGLKDWMTYMFDHTLLIEENDPFMDYFKLMEVERLADLRIIPTGQMGCEGLGKIVFDKFNDVLSKTDAGRSRVVKVEVFEHERNSAIFSE
jgi:6-pyruvoyltetrahydropterin/6-carboxytetrahydropterin synthase